MKAPGPRALCAGAASVAKLRLSHAARRPFHASARFFSPPRGNGGGGKPAEDSTVEHDDNQDDVFEPLTNIDISVGRSRNHSMGSLRNRQARRRIASALPPVKIPQTFLDHNVSLFEPDGPPPQLPLALREDAGLLKTTRPFKPPRASPNIGRPHRSRTDPATSQPDASTEDSDLHEYFNTAKSHLEARYKRLLEDFDNWRSPGQQKSQFDWSRLEPIEQAARISDMLIDLMKNFADSLFPCKQAQLYYDKRPFWWWDVHKDFDHNTHTFHGDREARLRNMKLSVESAQRSELSLVDTILDFPPETFVAFQSLIAHDLRSPPPCNFDAKTGKRPISILAMTGYGGKAISQSIIDQIAHSSEADLVRLDAYDLSVLIGDYLGQNWAYSRGTLSMLGFRAAELAGRLANEPENALGHHYARPGEEENDDEPELASPGSGARASPHASLVDELQKIREGANECFSKWEMLKIDKILDQIIGSASLKSSAVTTRSRALLIHVHDFVELSMTMEGNVLLNRLRRLVDVAWRQGFQIALVGTSASEAPSDEYQNAVRDLATGDFVVERSVLGHGILPSPRPIEHSQGRGKALHFSQRFRWNLLAADYAAENINNINRMLRAMDPECKVFLKTATPGEEAAYDVLRGPVLPVSEVYHLASTHRALEKQLPGLGDSSFTDNCGGQLLQRSVQTLVPEYAMAPETRSFPDVSVGGGDTLQEARYGKLNEYERRIASGQVKRESLRTTFDDIHVPPETISALKILTSLALIRPDAFSYGVLAADRIPGCLLYGPPGTGKTMLAKAVAKESGANMLEISGASINDKWVGESEKLIRAVFTMAKRLSPCVVFIDEADSILANRTMFNRASHRELINQFLKEWDGMEETNAFIMVATNRPFDLDDAVLRRLPRKLLVDLPTKDDRTAILNLILRGEKLADDVSLEGLAQRTPLYSGSDLKNVCVAAAMAAVEEENEAAYRHTGDEPFVFPDRRTLRAAHFERGLRQIPASISEHMVSLKMIRKFDEEYGKGRKGGRKTMGFGVLDAEGSDAARVRQYEP